MSIDALEAIKATLIAQMGIDSPIGTEPAIINYGGEEEIPITGIYDDASSAQGDGARDKANISRRKYDICFITNDEIEINVYTDVLIYFSWRDETRTIKEILRDKNGVSELWLK